jgi:hypothetical protein
LQVHDKIELFTHSLIEAVVLVSLWRWSGSGAGGQPC